jgi:hypothetical protein
MLNGKPEYLFEVIREWVMRVFPMETKAGEFFKMERTVTAGRIAESLLKDLDENREALLVEFSKRAASREQTILRMRAAILEAPWLHKSWRCCACNTCPSIRQFLQDSYIKIEEKV